MKGRLWLLVLFAILFSIHVNAAPIFINATSSDEDLIYGPFDILVRLNMSWDNKDYNVSADFSGIDGSPPENATDNKNGIYSVSHGISSFPADGIYSVTLSAQNTTDLSTTTIPAFYNITIDSTPPSITAENKSPAVSFENQSITLNATITDANGLKEVIISVNSSGNFINYSVSNNISSVYSFTLGKENTTSGQTVEWRYYARDKANNVAEGTLQLSQIVANTGITVVPLNPDGNNGWYVTEPSIVLTPDTGRTAYYRFNGGPVFTYTSPFSAGGIPGGIRVITYLSNDSSGNKEPEHTQTLKVDITKPVATSLFPANGSVTFNSSTKISATLTDIYGSNSGVNGSSAVLNVNGTVVIPQVLTNTSIVYYTPAPFPDGEVQVRIEGLKDFAGNVQQYTNWSFYINSTVINVNVTSPVNTTYNSTWVLISIAANQPVDMKYSDNGGSLATLATGASSFNATRTFSEGNHNVTFYFTSPATGASNQSTVMFSVDNNAPTFVSPLPTNTSYNKGFVNFSIKYTEKYLSNITLYTKTTDAGFIATQLSCIAGVLKKCGVLVDLSAYNGRLLYYFNITDHMFKTLSPTFNVTIDNVLPSLTVSSPVGIVYGSRRVPIIVSSDELVALGYSDNRGSFRGLCSSCIGSSRNVTFQEGNHNITIRAIDFAQNNFNTTINLTVDSIVPRIREIFPKDRSITNGTPDFRIRYTENNLKGITLYSRKQNDISFSANSLNGCASGSNRECSLNVDFTSHNGLLYYFFSISDEVRQVNSSVLNVSVDTLQPVISITEPVDSSIYSTSTVPLNVSINEKVKYIKRSLDGSSNMTMCSNCQEVVGNFNTGIGNHNLKIFVEDYVGHISNSSVFFTVS